MLNKITMEQTYDFDEIRCYNDSEVPEKLWTLVDRPEIEAFVKGAFPDIDMAQLRAQIKQITTIDGFQSAVVGQFVFGMIKKTSSSFEVYGAEKVDKEKAFCGTISIEIIGAEGQSSVYRLYEGGLGLFLGAVVQQ